jgi:hypothetical protein
MRRNNAATTAATTGVPTGSEITYHCFKLAFAIRGSVTPRQDGEQRQGERHGG